MRRRTRVILAICVGLVLVIGVGLFLAYRAVRHVPAAYRETLEADPVAQKEASDQMLRQTTNLINDVERGGKWEALFTEDQINGWLAVDLVENHPKALPAEVRDPRVAIEPDRMMLYCTVAHSDFSGVVTLTVDPFVPEPGVLALRICKMRVGALPWSLERITDGISRAAGRANISLQWRQSDGDPVALLSPRDKQGKAVEIDTIQLGDGEIYVSGTTGGGK